MSALRQDRDNYPARVVRVLASVVSRTVRGFSTGLLRPDARNGFPGRCRDELNLGGTLADCNVLGKTRTVGLVGPSADCCVQEVAFGGVMDEVRRCL